MPCKSRNCQRITSIFSFSSPIFKSILKSACISSTNNNVFVSSVCSVTFSNYPSHVSSRASSMGENFPLSNFTQIPLAMYSGTKWQKPSFPVPQTFLIFVAQIHWSYHDTTCHKWQWKQKPLVSKEHSRCVLVTCDVYNCICIDEWSSYVNCLTCIRPPRQTAIESKQCSASAN